MKKEAVICIVVVILIIFLDIISQNHTNTKMGEVQEELKEIREELISNNDKNLKEQSAHLKKEWQDKSNSFKYYIEHDELEKVEQYLWELDSNIETKEYAMAVQSLDTCDFIISHIKDKYKFSLKNIF